MSPAIASASTSSSPSVTGAPEKGVTDVVALLDTLTVPAEGQPNFSVMLNQLCAPAAKPENTEGAPGQAGTIPLPKVPVPPKGGGKTKTGDTTAINPAALFEANLLPVPLLTNSVPPT